MKNRQLLFVLALLAFSLVAQLARADALPTYVVGDHCTEYTLCIAQTGAGTCDLLGTGDAVGDQSGDDDEIAVEPSDFTEWTFYADQSTASTFSAAVKTASLGHDASGGVGVTIATLSNTAKLASYLGPLDYLWVDLASDAVGGNVKVVARGCLEDPGVRTEVRRRSLGADVSTSSGTAWTNLGLDESVAASSNYRIECHLFLQPSATTLGTQLQITGPASPTAVQWTRSGVVDSGGTTINETGGNAFHASNADDGEAASCVTGQAACESTVRINLRNGVNAGVVALAIQSETDTQAVTVKAGSYCDYQNY